MRLPFKKVLARIDREEAHGGSGERQLILSTDDSVSPHFQAMTKGFLAAGEKFDWHCHPGVDEFFLVAQGRGVIRFRTGIQMAYEPDQIIYVPADHEHQIENTGSEEGQFFFVRVNA